MRRHRFRAMGTSISVLGPDSRSFASAAACVQELFTTAERRFSRFRADSELARVNDAEPGWIEVSRPFAELARLALGWARATEGRFDPTVLPALVAAGYDRDFDDVLAGARDALAPPVPCGRWPEVEVSRDAILRPPGVRFDFGGIAKGWTVDAAVEQARRLGLGWTLVNAGGDLRLEGDTDPVEVGIEDPDVPSDETARLRLRGGAIATSSIVRRSWGSDLHHLIDPSTGSPVRTRLRQATVWAPTCTEAEVRAKDAVLRGDLGDQPGIAVTADGDLLTNLEPHEAVPA